MSKSTIELVQMLVLHWLGALFIGYMANILPVMVGFMLFISGYAIGGEMTAQGIEKRLKDRFGGKEGSAV